MANNSKRKLMFTTAVLTILLLSSAYAALMPNVNAAEITVQEKGLTISKDVVGLDTAEYAVNAKKAQQESYQGILPQETVRYELNFDDSHIEVLYTFVNDKLLMLDVLENQGSPRLTKTVNSIDEMAQDFLNSYQSYSDNSFYGELELSLVGVDPSRNSTKTVGNTKLEVRTFRNNFTDQQIFRWTYIHNGVEAPDKAVALGYKNGFLRYFYDSWDLYKIGSTEVNISEEEAITSAMERARAYSWSIETNDTTIMVKDFNVTGAMVWETVFRSSLVANKARNEDLLMLYPMRHVWVSLDKFYPPGNIYGFNVYIWADTGEVCYIQDRSTNQDPSPELVATIDDIVDNQLNQVLTIEAASNEFFPVGLAIPIFVLSMAIVAHVWIVRKKNLVLRRFPKIVGALLCVLLVSLLFFPFMTVNASSLNPRTTIWGAESTGAGEYPNSWRKHPDEIDRQREVAISIASDFEANGYSVGQYPGSNGLGSMKAAILDQISENQASYPRVAIVDFDHGNGNIGLPGIPSNEFHYCFEDNYGTFSGATYQQRTGPLHDHAVYDTDIYQRTAQDKVFFAFISTCNSAHYGSTFGGSSATQGLIPGTYRARGLPFALSHRTVYENIGGFNPALHLSNNGFDNPDDGDFVFLGFLNGSAPLRDKIDGSWPYYYTWLIHFFAFATSKYYDMSVNDALDHACALLYSGLLYKQTPLYTGFEAWWPMKIDGEWVRWIGDWPLFGTGYLKIYGNGDIHLHQRGAIWHLDGNGDDSLHDNDGDVHGATLTYPKFGSYALYFDGDNNDVDGEDYVEMDTFDYDFTEITAEFWMKTSDTTKNGTPLSISSDTEDHDNEFLIYNYKSFYIYINNAGKPTGKSANDGKWHHIAVTWRSSDGSLKLYKDGVAIWSGTHQTGATIDAENLILGQEQDSHGGGFDNSQAFKGAIDEVRIYDYVLSADQIADNAAVASLHFNGGDYAYDSSPYGNNGTLHGAEWDAGLRTSSGSSYGLSFDDYDYVNVPDHYSLDLSSAVTLEAWIKPSRLDVWQSPLEKGADNDWAYGFYIEPAGGNIGFEIGKEGSTVTWAGALAPVNSYLAVGKWSHIVGTADTATHKVCLYIDGVKVDERSFSGQINTNSIAFQIGKRSDGGYFGGIIDEVRIYDRALSASEISSYYDANKPVHWLTVTAICDPYGATLYPWVKIDGHYTDYINSLTRGSYTVEVEDPWWFPYGEFEFDRFTYDGTTVTSNPMPMYVSKDTEVIAHYTLSGW